MDVVEKKLALFDAHLSHKGLQHLVDVASVLLGNPLFMADMSMGIVFKSSNMGEGLLDYSAENDIDRQSQAVRQAADAGFLDWIYRHDEPVIGEFEDQPRYLSARVRDGSQVLGHIVVVETEKHFDDSDKDLLPVICQTISFELRRTRSAEIASEAYAPLLGELIEGTVHDEQVVRRRLSSSGRAFPQQMVVLLFRVVDETKTVSENYLHAQLDKAFPLSLGIQHGTDYVRVIDGSASLDAIDSRLRTSVYLGGMAVGVSRPCRKATALRLAYLQADAALRLGARRTGGGVYPYDAVAAAHLLELASRLGFDREAVIVSWIDMLEAFDERDGTEHVRSLAAYLNNGRNVAKASSELHVHKNSMYYRIQRIEELTGVNLSDESTCFLLQLSLAMLGMGPMAESRSLE